MNANEGERCAGRNHEWTRMDTNLRESASSAGFRALVFWKLGSVQSAAVWCSLVQFGAVFAVRRLQQTAVDCSWEGRGLRSVGSTFRWRRRGFAGRSVLLTFID